MFCMVPIAKDDSKLFVVRICFLRWMQGYWTAKTINVLALEWRILKYVNI
jgi:hypothetical protein